MIHVVSQRLETDTHSIDVLDSDNRHYIFCVTIAVEHKVSVTEKKILFDHHLIRDIMTIINGNFLNLFKARHSEKINSNLSQDKNLKFAFSSETTSNNGNLFRNRVRCLVLRLHLNKQLVPFNQISLEKIPITRIQLSFQIKTPKLKFRLQLLQQAG